jgi:hypothetical protein
MHSKETTYRIDRTNEDEDLRPSQERHGFNGRHAIGDVLEGQTRRNVTTPPVELGHHVADDSQHGDTAVLDLRRSVLIELLLRRRQAEGVKVAGGQEHARFVREGHRQGGGRASGGGHEGRGRTDECQENGSLHGDHALLRLLLFNRERGTNDLPKIPHIFCGPASIGNERQTRRKETVVIWYPAVFCFEMTREPKLPLTCVGMR